MHSMRHVLTTTFRRDIPQQAKYYFAITHLIHEQYPTTQAIKNNFKTEHETDLFLTIRVTREFYHTQQDAIAHYTDYTFDPDVIENTIETGNTLAEQHGIDTANGREYWIPILKPEQAPRLTGQQPHHTCRR